VGNPELDFPQIVCQGKGVRKEEETQDLVKIPQLITSQELNFLTG
jgi:hypothetical protein